jgi:hypothetical protein
VEVNAEQALADVRAAGAATTELVFESER